MRLRASKKEVVRTCYTEIDEWWQLTTCGARATTGEQMIAHDVELDAEERVSG